MHTVKRIRLSLIMAMALAAPCFVAFASTLPATPAPAPGTASTNTSFRPNVTMLEDDTEYDVQADGSYVRDEARMFRIETEQGVQRNAQVPIRYSASLEALDIVGAWTVTKDGRRIDVTPAQIREQQSAESARAPMFDDNKVKVVVFPGVEVGATLALHFRKTQKIPLFPGQFFALQYFDDGVARNEARLTIRAPASMTLHVEAIDLPGGRVAADRPGTQLWKWSLHDQPARPPELSSISDLDHSPRVAITSFADYPSIGAAYDDRALDKASISPRIQALADQLTQGVTDRRRQAELIYNWVATNIRYVAIYLGFGGVVPHDADAILAAAYGDCKDHTTLLTALLAAKGIRSETVLLNAGNTYWLPKVALPLGVFNHAINYLPEFDVFVDSTASLAPFGVLPASELGKPVLVTGADAATRGIHTLPLSTPENGRVASTTQLRIDADGTVSGSTRIDESGVFDLTARSIFASLPPGIESQIGERMLSATGQDGSGTYEHGDPRIFRSRSRTARSSCCRITRCFQDLARFRCRRDSRASHASAMPSNSPVRRRGAIRSHSPDVA